MTHVCHTLGFVTTDTGDEFHDRLLSLQRNFINTEGGHFSTLLSFSLLGSSSAVSLVRRKNVSVSSVGTDPPDVTEVFLGSKKW